MVESEANYGSNSVSLSAVEMRVTYNQSNKTDNDAGNFSDVDMIDPSEVEVPLTQDAAEVTIKTSPRSIGFFRHPKIRQNWKVIAVALLLFVAGLIFFCSGIGILCIHPPGIYSVVFFIAGLICIIPGAYHLVYVYCAMRGYQGYSFQNLPQMD